MTRLALCAIGAAIVFTGCADLNNLNKSLAETNNSLLAGRTMGAASGSTVESRVEVPNDQRVNKAFEAALPRIKTILGVHKCINHQDGLLLLNKEAAPGVQISAGQWEWAGSNFPNSQFYMKYHNRAKCLDVRSIDQVSMPANNALSFRTVFFAEDSGETVSFGYLLKKQDNGDWLLGQRPRGL